MANIERPLFHQSSMVANSTIIVGPGGSLFKGTVPIFWPRNEAGVFGQGRELVEFRLLLTTGNDVSIGTDLETTSNGFTLSFDPAPMEKETRLLKVENSGALGLVRITAIFKDWPTESSRLGDVEAKVAAIETKVADHETRIKALETPTP